jgi:autotransporter-associated beta strand protein
MFPNAASTISGTTYNAGEQLSGSGGLEVYGGGVLTLYGADSYTGGTLIDQGTTVILSSASAAGTGAITFSANADATLLIGGGTPTNVIGGLTKGDVIDLALLPYIANSGGVTISGNSLIVSNGNVAQTLTLANDSIGMGFTLSSDSTGGTNVSVTCFAAGTLITTVDGAISVEALRVGDLLPTLIREDQAPIVWIGRRHVDCSRHPEPQRVWPVRIAAGAFGDGLPQRDLLLSPDHAVFVDNVLIPIKYLVNGSSIVQQRIDRVTYYHVELARHDVLKAEGLPVETYLDAGNRASFDNGGAIVRLHPDFATRAWEAAACAELVVSGPQLAAVLQRLAGFADRLAA